MDRLADIMEQLRATVVEAQRLAELEPLCASLATAGLDARPSVRTVFIERIEPEGLVLCVHTESGKAQQMLANPRVGLCFYWPNAQKQINVDGRAVLLSEQESDSYWATRSRESQLGAWASSQPERLEDAAALGEKLQSAKDQFSFERVPRPATWRAFRIEPDRVEFWHSNWQRLRGRERYQKDDSGTWQVDKYQP